MPNIAIDPPGVAHDATGADRAGAPTDGPGRLGLALAVIAVLAAAVGATGIWARSTYGAQVSSDEPQYLLTALSIAHDLDLDISDEIAARDHLPFHEIQLDQQTIPLGDGGQELSPHDPLLPALLALPMSAGGWVLARATLVAIAALTALTALWVAVRRFGTDTLPASVAVGAVAVGAPMAAYATQVFPEMPAASALVALVAAGTARPLRARHVAGVLVAATALAWLSVKYVPVAAVATSIVLWPLVAGRRWLALATTGLVGVASSAAYLIVHQRVYGGWTVYAAGDHFATAGEFAVVGNDPDYAGRSRRLIGLLVDRRYGLVPWAPVWILVPPAVAWMLIARVRHRRVIAAVMATGWLMATFVAFTMHGWWSPGRQLVVISPLAAIAVAVLVDRFRRLAWPTVALGAIGACNWIWLAVESSTGRRTIIVDFAETAAFPYRAVEWLFAPGVPTNPVGDRALIAWTAVAVLGMWWVVGRMRSAVRSTADRAPVTGDQVTASR